VPDPQDPARSTLTLNWQLVTADNEALKWYSALIELRKRFVISAERIAMLRVVTNGATDAVLMTVLGTIRSSRCWSRSAARSCQRSQPIDQRTRWEKVLSAASERCAVAVYVSS